MRITSINPATEQPLASFEELSAEQMEAVIGEVAAAFAGWRETSIVQRTALVRRAAAVLHERKGRYAALMTAEMGKPIVEAEAEVEKCAWNCDWYADNAARFLAHEPVSSNAMESYV